MKYLHLKFKNAGLIPQRNNPHFNRFSDGFGKYDPKGNETGYDIACPIPYNVLSGVLAKMCGEIPVPTKRHTYFKRIDILDNIAKNSFVYYDYKPLLNEKGYVTNSEFFQTSKSAYNAHNTVNTLFNVDGAIVSEKGRYNWDYLRRSFPNKEDFKTLVNFLNEILEENCENLTFNELFIKLSSKWLDKEFIEKVEFFLNSQRNDYMLASWKRVLFGFKKLTGNNTAYNTRTPLLLKNGFSKIVYVSGDIICPIENEDVITQLHENGGTATILEGGLVYIVGLENYPPIPNYKRFFEKIFEEKVSQTSDNQENV